MVVYVMRHGCNLPASRLDEINSPALVPVLPRIITPGAAGKSLSPVRVVVQRRATDPTWTTAWLPGISSWTRFGVQSRIIEPTADKSPPSDRAIDAILSEERPDLFVVTSGYFQISDAMRRKWGCHYDLLSAETARLVRNKRAFAQWMVDRGFKSQVPPMLSLSDYLLARGKAKNVPRALRTFPVLVKESEGEGGKNVFLAQSADKVSDISRQFFKGRRASADVQAVVPGIQYVMHFWAREGRIVGHVCCLINSWFEDRHRHTLLSRMQRSVATVLHCQSIPGLLLQHSRLLKALNYSGHGCIQSILTDERRHVVFDFNARLCFSAVSQRGQFVTDFTTMLRTVATGYREHRDKTCGGPITNISRDDEIRLY